MDVEQAAHLMGMKVREVTAVVETADGHVVTTHDGYRTLIRPDGSMRHGVGEPVPVEKRAPIKVQATVGKRKA